MFAPTDIHAQRQILLVHTWDVMATETWLHWVVHERTGKVSWWFTYTLSIHFSIEKLPSR